MIQFSQRLIDILSEPTIESFYMVSILNYAATNYPTNITLSNNETFLSDGKLLSITPPKLSTVVDRESYTVTFADPDFSFGQFAETGLVGQIVKVRIGFVDQTTQLPLLDFSDTVLIYKGQVDGLSYTTDTSSIGSVIFILTCASPMANLDGVKSFYGSKPFIRGLNPEDNSFDQIYEGSGKLNLKWGKR